MRRIVLLGAGDTGAEVAELLERSAQFAVVGFLDDRKETGSWHAGLPILGGTDDETACLDRAATDACVCISWDSHSRARLTARVSEWGLGLPSLVHPLASVSPNAQLEPGCLIFSFATVLPFATIGRGAILKSFARASYGSTVGDFALLAPYSFIGPRARVGAHTQVRSRATVRQDVRVGGHRIVGVNVFVESDMKDAAPVDTFSPAHQRGEALG